MAADEVTQKRWLLVLAATSFTTGGFIFSAREELYYNWEFSLASILALAWGLIGVGVASMLLYYLRGDLGPERRRQADNTAALEAVVFDIAQLRQHVNDAILASPTADADSATIRLKLRDELLSDVTSRFHEKYGAAAHELHRVTQIRQNFQGALDRLRQEIAVLGRRANLNLIIGVLVTMLAAAELISLLQPTVEQATWPHFIEYYVPRIGTVVLVEIFGFFFLRLYKANLAEIKYYQNEMTSLGLQWSAFEAAALPNTSTIVVEQFVKSDRNAQPSAVAASPTSAAGPVDTKVVAQIIQKTADTILKPTAS